MTTPATDAIITAAVDKFLCWKLPQNFQPDSFISFDGKKHDTWGGYPNSWPTGTNLLDAGQARTMFEHCLNDALAALQARDQQGPIKTWQERLEETCPALGPMHIHACVEEVNDAMQAEIDDLRAAMQAREGEAVAIKDAVGCVLEGWTLPEPVRKILETAYYAAPQPAQPSEPAQPEYFAQYEYAPDFSVLVAVYRRRADQVPELIHKEALPKQIGDGQPAQPVALPLTPTELAEYFHPRVFTCTCGKTYSLPPNRTSAESGIGGGR